MLALRLSVHPAGGGDKAGRAVRGLVHQLLVCQICGGKLNMCICTCDLSGYACSQGMLAVRGNDVTHCQCCASAKCRRIHPVLESPHVC